MNEWNNNPLIRQFEQFKTLSPHNTKSEFARRCGIGKSTMSQYLGNKLLVSAKGLTKICKALKCQKSDVIERTTKEG